MNGCIEAIQALQMHAVCVWIAASKFRPGFDHATRPLELGFAYADFSLFLEMQAPMVQDALANATFSLFDGAHSNNNSL